MQHLVFYVWDLSQSVMIVKLLDIVAFVVTSLLEYLVTLTYNIYFVGRCLGSSFGLFRIMLL